MIHQISLHCHVTGQKSVLRWLVVGCVVALLMGALVDAAWAESVEFDFASSAGSNQTGLELDGLQSGVSQVNGTTFAVTLTATAQVGDSEGVLNYSSSPNFGINASGGGDVTDAFDAGGGFSESMVFSITSSTPASYTFVAIDFDRIAGGGNVDEDAGSLAFAGGNTYHFNGSTVDGTDLLTVGEPFTAGQAITLAHVDGNGFGIERIILDVVPVPAPSTVAVLAVCLLGLGPRRPTRGAESAHAS